MKPRRRKRPALTAKDIDADAFWARVHHEPNTGCWLWGGSMAHGYGRVWGFRNLRSGWAHRLAWELSRGRVRKGWIVGHRCDMRACVNPAHLYTGTRLDVQDTTLLKGRDRRAFGEAHIHALLTDATVMEARRRWAEGAPPPCTVPLSGGRGSTSPCWSAENQSEIGTQLPGARPENVHVPRATEQHMNAISTEDLKTLPRHELTARWLVIVTRTKAGRVGVAGYKVTQNASVFRVSMPDVHGNPVLFSGDAAGLFDYARRTALNSEIRVIEDARAAVH